jgi:hypothetical protein
LPARRQCAVCALLLALGFLFCGQDLERKVTKLSQQRDVLLKILMQSLHIYVPIKMYDSVAKGHHRHHRFAERDIKIAGFSQETEHISAFLRMAELVNRNDVRSNVRATLYGGLEGTFYRQLAREISPERLESNRLLPL